MVAHKSNLTVDDIYDREGWLESISEKRTLDDLELIRQAYDFAQTAHEKQTRASGEPYFLHPLTVANILAELRLDAETLAAALLHDVVEDTAISLKDIENRFGGEVAKLVDGVTKMEYIEKKRDENEKLLIPEVNKKQKHKQQIKSETFRKMMLAMGEDVRVVLIKLADRIHNVRTLSYTREEKQKRVARETLDIFAPLANRLGIWQMKWELEDLSFRYLDEKTYRDIASMVDERRTNRERYLNQTTKCLEKQLRLHNIKAKISGRPKHIYSIWKKMTRKKVRFEQIYDVLAVRIIVESVADCYRALGVVHAQWSPIPREFDDYIAAPKDNHYQSLHTAVKGPKGKPLEVQIRTEEMHHHAEYGVAAHWRYKEEMKANPMFDKKMAWIRGLMDWEDGVTDAETFVDSVKVEVFQARVHVFTPQGDIYDLVSGATPIDFAYLIHTEIGHRCRGAKIDGRIVPLTYKLKSGDTVEIIVTKRGGPSRDWLNPHLGYLKTARAKTKARHWFRHQNDEVNITQGRSILERELKRLGLTNINHDDLAQKFSFNKTDNFFSAIGRGEITTPKIATKIHEAYNGSTAENERDDVLLLPISKPQQRSANEIDIDGAGGMLSHIAKCCHPLPGDDDIIGYVTRGRGVSVHRQDCKNVLRLAESSPDRLIQLSWKPKENAVSAVDIEIEAIDRPGLLRDVSTLVAEDGINILTVTVGPHHRRYHVIIYATIEVNNYDQLSRVLSRLERLPNVINAYRNR